MIRSMVAAVLLIALAAIAMPPAQAGGPMQTPPATPATLAPPPTTSDHQPLAPPPTTTEPPSAPDTEHQPNWADITLAVGTGLLALATAVLAGAAVFALREIGEARRDRNAQVAIDTSHRWNDVIFRRVRNEIDKAARQTGGLVAAMVEYRANTDSRYRQLLMEPDFFEDLAILINYGAIDFDIVRDSLGGTIVRRWGVWEPFIVGQLRKVEQVEGAYVHFAGLAEDMRKVKEAREKADQDAREKAERKARPKAEPAKPTDPSLNLTAAKPTP